MKSSDQRLASWARTSGGFLVFGLACACQGEVVEVGDVEDSTGRPSMTEETTASETTTGDASCTDQGSDVRAPYDAWLAQENDFEDDDDVSLLGKTFQGYIEGGADITLQIEADGSALFFTGELVERPMTDKDKGYLCGAAESQQERQQLCLVTLMESVPYVIRGASLENGRLLVPLQENAPYDPWCAGQTPILFDTSGDECLYHLYPNSEMGWGEICTIGDEVVDCGWMETTGWMQDVTRCSCTSSECFANVYSVPLLELDARVSDSPSEIRGSLIDDGVVTPIYLFEVTE